jgi:hypothetical protein
MGFHAPAEAVRILAESIDYARQGQLLARLLPGGPAAPGAAPASPGLPPPPAH